MKILFLKNQLAISPNYHGSATSVFHRNSITILSVLVKKQRFLFFSTDKTITVCIMLLDYVFDSGMLNKSNFSQIVRGAMDHTRTQQVFPTS